MNHTPGPWREYAPTISGEIDENYRYIEADDPAAPTRRAFMLTGFVSPADARLIAAAPDLLNAARDALDQFEQMEKMFRDDLEFMGALSAVRAAIAKATT